VYDEQTSKPHGGEFHAGTLVRGMCVRVSDDTARVGIPGQEPVAEPRIELIRSGDTIQAIDIICGCGQQIRLHCHYEGERPA
jgi:hypothetical protein